MSGEGKGKKRSKAFYRKSAHGAKSQKTDDYKLIPGIRGFLVTCNHNESGAIRESYNILNEYADSIYGQGKSTLNPTDCADVPDASDSEDSDDDDVEKAMKKEIDGLKTVPSQQRRFQKCQSKAKNLLFIRSTVDDPIKVCQLIMEDIAEKRLQRARYAARILPVVGTCKAHTPDIEKLAQTCLRDIFSPENPDVPLSYTIMFRARNNSTTTCGKMSVIPGIKEVVKVINPKVEFSWSDFDVAVMVEVVCTICCLAVAPSFTRLRKYNLQELQQGPRVMGDTENDSSIMENDSSKADNENVDGNGEANQKSSVIDNKCNDAITKQTNASEKEEQKLSQVEDVDLKKDNGDTEMSLSDIVENKDDIDSTKINISDNTNNKDIVMKSVTDPKSCLSHKDSSEKIQSEPICSDKDVNSVNNEKQSDPVLNNEDCAKVIPCD